MRRASLTTLFIVATLVASSAWAADPEIGKTARYCNPLPMVTAPGGNASGDVTVIREQDRYYMYCTGGGAWISDDMLAWSFHRVANVPVAPHVVKYNGSFYMCGNSGPLLRADNPLGPFASLREWKNTPDAAGGWRGPFDMDIYIDDDNQPYLYYPGRGVDGIYVVPLDPNDLTRFAGPVRHLFAFNRDHVWERYGEMNEYTDVAWIEGPWMQKYNGTYYLQYSGSGTQWKTYASGYYTAKSPLGPFTYASNNPLLRRTDGLVTGTAHGSIVEGPDGHLWQFYTIVLSNPPGGRRIGMDRIAFDKDGNMAVKVTDTPQWAPGAVRDPATGDSGSVPLTINKFRAMNALSRCSSEQPGREAAYAVDHSSGTWWEPAATDTQPTLTVELSPATRFDAVQLFTIDSVRLMFQAGRGFGFGGGRRGAPGVAGVPPARGEGVLPSNPNRGLDGRDTTPPTDAYQYKIEVSLDGQTYTSALDQTENATSRNTIFEEIPPAKCRFVRLTMTDWPRATPLGIIEFTVFGRPAESLPAAQPSPGTR